MQNNNEEILENSTLKEEDKQIENIEKNKNIDQEILEKQMKHSYHETNVLGNKKKREKFSYVKVWTSALLFGVIAGGSFFGVNEIGQMVITKKEKAEVPKLNTTTVSSEKKQNNKSGNISSIVEEVMPSIVSIHITEIIQNPYANFFYQGNGNNTIETSGSGSGIIINQTDTELLILTNSHVVSDADTLNVDFIDGESVEGVVKSMNKHSDLAIVSIPLSDIKENTFSQIKVATIGDSSEMKVGDEVIAIGNALGYGQSVTKGIISAKDKELSEENSTLSHLIQTDAAINPGNSGGALLNENGEVIGINVAKYSSTEIEGIGFAIPISESNETIQELMSQETRTKLSKEEKGYLNISVQDIDKTLTEKYHIPQGVYIANVVKDGAADKAGLKSGDIITKIEKTEITCYDDLENELTYHKAGEKLELTYQCSENNQYKEKKVQITLGKLVTTPVENKKEEEE